MKKIMFVHRASSVYCCPKGLNFSIVQEHPSFLTKRPVAERSLGLEADLRSLLEEADESDCICDVVFSILNDRIPAHRFILESHSKNFSSLITSAEKMQASTLLQSDVEMNGNACPKKQICVVVKIEGINPVIFKEMLKYVYTGTCNLSQPDQWSVEKDSEYLYFSSVMKGTWTAPPIVCEEEGRGVSDGSAAEKTVKGRCQNLSGGDEWESNPVIDARKAAVRFGLSLWVKQLDTLQYIKATCCVQRKFGSVPSVDLEKPPKLSLNQHSCTHLCDVIIECEGGKIINAHKCVLAMRSKYFETMFKGDWIECTGFKNIKIPFSLEVMQAIISFLYQNKVPALNKSDDLTYLWNVLITSDQILLEGLKETCEILLVNHITLKNVSEFYQISDTYNAEKLKQFCLEYMCVNLYALLECRALDDIDPELFDDLQLHYWSTRPVVLTRCISPPSKYPDLKTLKNILEVIGIPSEEEHFRNSESALRKEAIESSKRSRAKRKQKSRPTSVDDSAGHLSRLSLGSNSGMDFDLSFEKSETLEAELENCEPFDECLLVSCPEESEKDPPPQTEESSRPSTDPIAVPKQCSSSLPTARERRLSSVCDEDFPMLSSDVHQASVSASSKTPKNRRMTKMSQKERKKQLMSASAIKKDVENGDSPCKPEVNPWGKLAASPHEGSPMQVEQPSLSEIMDEERRRRPPPRKLQYSDSTGEENKQQKPFVWSVEGSPGLPPMDGARGGGGWPTTPPSSEEQAVGPKSFNEIVADEIKQREMTKKMMDKPLNFTLMEDRAIKELQLAYDREHEHDERITVRRITSAQVSKPVWCNSKNN